MECIWVAVVPMNLAVLGNQLATLLVDWLGALSQMMTPTMMGPQPPANLAKVCIPSSKS